MGIHRKVVEFAEAGRSFAAALVLAADGSTPGKAGARALIDATGRIWGTIGGGRWPTYGAAMYPRCACTRAGSAR